MKDLNLTALELRNARLRKLNNKKFDLLIIGAGVHGSLTAWIASRLGYSVLLIDAADYAQGTSSRSSKLLHGGVRYLEQGHLSLVYKSLHERAEFMRMAPHLTRNLPFLFAAKDKVYLTKIALSLYENIAKFWADSDSFDFSNFKKQLADFGLSYRDLIHYHDGQVNDSRFCIEAVSEAREAGAECFNYLSFNSAEYKSGSWVVELEDKINSEKIILEVDKIANLAGAGVRKVHENCFQSWPSNWPSITYSTGVHLYFDLEIDSAGLILPAESRGRYYFVLPVFSAYRKGVYVGTTDCKVSNADCYPTASEREVEQLLRLIKKDLPNLDVSSLYHRISGTRVLAGDGLESHQISREVQILKLDNYVTLLGGKYTSARRTAMEVLEKLFIKKYEKLNLLLSGSSEKVNFNKKTDLVDIETSAAINRFGANAQLHTNTKLELKELMLWQIKYCIKKEDALCWDDIFIRRLNLDYLPKGEPIRVEYEKIESEFTQLS